MNNKEHLQFIVNTIATITRKNYRAKYGKKLTLQVDIEDILTPVPVKVYNGISEYKFTVRVNIKANDTTEWSLYYKEFTLIDETKEDFKNICFGIVCEEILSKLNVENLIEIV